MPYVEEPEYFVELTEEQFDILEDASTTLTNLRGILADLRESMGDEDGVERLAPMLSSVSMAAWDAKEMLDNAWLTALYVRDGGRRSSDNQQAQAAFVATNPHVNLTSGNTNQGEPAHG
jgi:hypothetical protein